MPRGVDEIELIVLTVRRPMRKEHDANTRKLGEVLGTLKVLVLLLSRIWLPNYLQWPCLVNDGSFFPKVLSL